MNSFISDGDDTVFFSGSGFPGTASAPRILLLPCFFDSICRDIALFNKTRIFLEGPHEGR